MSDSIRGALLGVLVTLLVVAGVAGVWSMGVAPPPPAVAAARQESAAVKAEIQDKMREFLRHHSRVESALKAGDTDLAAAHLVVMRDTANTLDQRHLSQIPPEKMGRLEVSLDEALNLVRKKDPAALPSVQGVLASCVRCHITQNGPNLGEVVGDALQIR